MLMLEAEGKALLAGAGLPIPPGGRLVRTPEDLAGLPLEFPLAAKAQVRSGGRGKAGGVRRCDSPADLEAAVAGILGTRFGGELPAGVLLEPWLPIAREMYLSIVVDGRAGGFVVTHKTGQDGKPRGISARPPFRPAVARVEPEHRAGSSLPAVRSRVEPCVPCLEKDTVITVDDEHVLLTTRPSQAWLMKLSGPCLMYDRGSPSLMVTSNMGRIQSGFDRIGSLRQPGLTCIIREIRPVDMQAMREHSDGNS